jgi:hypothetical protein
MPMSPFHETYADALAALSDASTRVKFDAFLDVPWDDPDYQIDPRDPRWKLPSVDPLGRHAWYQGLPEEEQIRIGLLRQANVLKTGIHFEGGLMKGLLQHAQALPNGSPEFRYCMHEVTEETHHTQMFQEFINRAGVDVAGAPRWFRALASLAPLSVALTPEIFFLLVLLGEEPVDHIQKQILRAGEEVHPLLERIMQIHVAEEARHISFAHEFLANWIETANPVRRAMLAVSFPLYAKIMGTVITMPSTAFARQAGVPASVMRDLYKQDDAQRSFMAEMFGDVRYAAEKLGVLNSFTTPLWKALGVYGRPSRHRGDISRPDRG